MRKGFHLKIEIKANKMDSIRTHCAQIFFLVLLSSRLVHFLLSGIVLLPMILVAVQATSRAVVYLLESNANVTLSHYVQLPRKNNSVLLATQNYRQK